MQGNAASKRELFSHPIEFAMRRNSALSEKEILELVGRGDREAYKEISEIINKPIGTVMSSLYYAKKRLKDLIAKHLGF